MLASYDAEIESFNSSGSGGIWSANDTTLVMAISDFSLGDTSLLIWLDQDLNERRRLNVPVPAPADIFGPLSFTEYFFELDSTTFLLGQTVVENLCFNGPGQPTACGTGPVYIRRLNLAGETIWRYHSDTISGETARSFANQVIYQPAVGTTYVACEDDLSPTNRARHRLISIDSSGQEQWQEGFPATVNQYSADLAFSPEGDIIGLANLDLNYWTPETGETFYTANPYLYKVTPEQEVLWKRNLIDSTYLLLSGDVEQQLNDILVEPDGSIVLIGTIRVPPELENGTGPDHIWLLRLNAEGCLSPDCGEFVLTRVEDAPTSLQAYLRERLSIFPNPANDFITLDWPEPLTENRHLLGKVQVVDEQGKVVRTSGPIQLPYRLSLDNLPAGQYLARWEGEARRIAVGKFLVR
ncbi:MAG: T9SS type A sorting domain-containing protein [Bacteroidota bacterium]